MNLLPPLAADTRTVTTAKATPRQRFWEFAGVVFVLGLGLLAWVLGLFVNFIMVLLLVLAPVGLIRLAWNAWRQRIYFGLVTRPCAVESREYWWPCLAPVVFYLSCGHLLDLGGVPFQAPDLPREALRITSWVLVALQIALALLPAKRISWPRVGLFSVGTVFVVWHFIRVTIPASGEAIRVGSPMRGVSCVLQGGVSSLINHHYPVESQRHAVDVFKVAETLEEERSWKILREDDGFGQKLHSPCDGRVAHCEDLHPDNAKGQTDAEHPAGNYLTIEISPNRYILLAHLKRQSILVKPGDRVKAGQPIAQCGNSGNTTGPHVHMQAQTSPTFGRDTRTLPMTFRSVLRKDKRLEDVQVKRNDLLLLMGDW